MVAFNFGSVLVMIVALSATSAAPVQKRIAQVITDATKDWEQACLAAGGGQACNPLSVAAFSALLAAPDACAQQNAADNMIDLAKQLNNNTEMVRLTGIYRQQPRNSPDSLSVLYCQSAPRNRELQGLFQCQFSGVNPKVFTGNRAVGEPGTIPFGLSAAVNPAGSCPASKTPIPDGQQLNKIVANPNAGAGAGAGNATTKPTSTAKTPPPPPTAAVTSTPATGGQQPFTVQNGLDAQALNEKFKTLTANSRCTAGEQACIEGSFAQCVDGRFVLSACAGGTSCFALPLVLSRGVSLTCTTAVDAQARIATAIGTDAGAVAPTSQAPPRPTATATRTPTPSPPAASNSAVPAVGGAKSFTLQNGLDAQALNKKFASLTPNSACSAGDNACVNGGFAQCVGGKFVVTGCAGGLTCASVPLLFSRGTSIVCTTQSDAIARIAATGASASLTG